MARGRTNRRRRLPRLYAMTAKSNRTSLARKPGSADLLELPEPPHAREPQSLARLEVTRTALQGHLIVRQHEAGHREVDPPER